MISYKKYVYLFLIEPDEVIDKEREQLADGNKYNPESNTVLYFGHEFQIK